MRASVASRQSPVGRPQSSVVSRQSPVASRQSSVVSRPSPVDLGLSAAATPLRSPDENLKRQVLCMTRLLPDPTFYPSPRLAGEAPAEKLAYVALLASGEDGKTDALGVVDTDPQSPSYGRVF